MTLFPVIPECSSNMLARKGLLPDGFLLTRLAEDQNQPNRSRSKSQRARFITKTGSCNVAHKNIREQVQKQVLLQLKVLEVLRQLAAAKNNDSAVSLMFL